MFLHTALCQNRVHYSTAFHSHGKFKSHIPGTAATYNLLRVSFPGWAACFACWYTNNRVILRFISTIQKNCKQTSIYSYDQYGVCLTKSWYFIIHLKILPTSICFCTRGFWSSNLSCNCSKATSVQQSSSPEVRIPLYIEWINEYRMG
jgi:hypothetical protein